MSSDERSHARVFGYLAVSPGGVKGSDVAKMEGRRHRGGGNSLRAAVLGANDGLVSVFCLVMGVAGAGVGSKYILLTGLSGLLAGSLSMALGEWLSVQNSREFYENQISSEKTELEEAPEEEIEELALIYQAKGLDEKSARELANRLNTDPVSMLDTLAREELGINPEELGGSAVMASVTSFLLFAAGGILPVIPYIFLTGPAGIITSAVLSGAGLFLLGAVTSLMTGKGLMMAGLRQLLVGLATAALTFAAGSLIGVNFK
jgi:VIT1/CCC1 family predicted Fe2+/Mn2+ transporter